MAQHDSEATLFYQDPPYVHATRAIDAMHGNHGYAHEMTDADHEALAEANASVRGMVIISGYPGELYDRLYAKWQRIERDARADSAAKRVEVLWFNDAAWERLPSKLLFGAA